PEMWVIVGLRIGVNADAVRQFTHAVAHFMQHIEVDLGAGLWPQTTTVAEGYAGLQCRGDDVRQFVNFGIAKAALRDPGCADADARRPQSAAVAGDGLTVEDDSGQIKDARSHIAAEGCAIRPDNRFAIDQ